MKVNQAIAISAIVTAVVAGGVYFSQDASTGAPVDDTITVPLTIVIDPCEDTRPDNIDQHLDCTLGNGALEGNENETHEGIKPNDGGSGNTSAITRG